MWRIVLILTLIPFSPERAGAEDLSAVTARLYRTRSMLIRFASRGFNVRITSLFAAGSINTAETPNTGLNWTDPLPLVLERLEGVETLEVVGVSLTQRQLRRLCGGARLRALHLQCCPLCIQKCAVISRTHNLVELQLIDSRLTDDHLEILQSLPVLEMLDVRGNPISDAALPALVDWPQLRWLDIRGTQVTPLGVAALRRRRPDLHVLCDEHTTATAAGTRLGESIRE
ncbi:MAG: hypothetical protein ACK5Q5_11885 [Planctomycetaceae bacterium]